MQATLEKRWKMERKALSVKKPIMAKRQNGEVSMKNFEFHAYMSRQNRQEEASKISEAFSTLMEEEAEQVVGTFLTGKPEDHS